ncbi:hypothetical protein [Cryobacterium fucosi]|uniref:Uncharacterized protein n=1 Tax=Cryobacterium fucosi TaxID=1259157 RepID=A0A4R9BE76_9MICO|nr:hypothetical protein [Cryobacterium fucosi]TFD82221.1 hypothetical protein E3T48_02395 [Cryobacterium fucosi]
MGTAPTPFSSRIRIIAVVVAALLAGPLLAGCSADAVGGAVNGAVQGATGGDVSLAGQLPSGWPEEVPVVDGRLFFGATKTEGGKRTWVVTVKSDAADPLAEVKATLTDAGFVLDESPSASVGTAGVVAMKNANFAVVVVGNTDGLLYTVTPLA